MQFDVQGRERPFGGRVSASAALRFPTGCETSTARFGRRNPIRIEHEQGASMDRCNNPYRTFYCSRKAFGKKTCRWAGLVLAALSFPALSQTYAWQEGYKQVIPSTNVEALTADGMFGERIGLYNGSLSFTHTDVSLKGNNALPVAYGIYYTLDDPKVRRGWQVDIPHMEGTYTEEKGWWRADFAGNELPRCSSGKAAPPLAKGGVSGDLANQISTWDASEYWSGDFLKLGTGSEEILKAGTGGAPLPSNGETYPWLTKSGWRISCVDTAANDPGEGFLAVSPDGIRYRFDWFTTQEEEQLKRPQGQGPAPIAPPDGFVARVNPAKIDYLFRKRVLVYPTRIEDRFGNYVTYAYGPSGVISITADDGRAITVTYGATKQVTAHGRVWTYWSDANGYHITQPDGSQWIYDFSHLSSLLHYPTSPGGTTPTQYSQCDAPPTVTALDPPPNVGTITHPSGAIGTFTVAPRRHGRSYVDRNCIGGTAEPGSHYYYPYRSYWFDTMSITSRTITGPGLPTQTWTYQYGPANSSWAANCPSDSCIATKYVDVVEPDGVRTRHTFSNRYGVLEGQELKTETFDASAVLRRTVTYTYQTDSTGQPYAAKIGTEGFLRGDQSATKFDPVKTTTITQDGTMYVRTVNKYDIFARPTEITRASAPAP